MRCDTQVRFAPSGHALGFDLQALLSVAAALGYDRRAFVALIGGAEVGMLQGIRERQYGDA